MLQQPLIRLKDWILRYNTYFNNAFPFVRLDDKLGIVADDEKLVFPADNLGNYFYFRLPNKVTFDYNTNVNISDTYNSIGLRANVVLVACMLDADADQLAYNLAATLGRYQDLNIRLIDTVFHSEDVLIQELAKMDSKENLQAALQRLPQNMTIVSITFNITTPYIFQQLNCLTNPCSPC